jgi:hypothetical protein
MTETLKIPGLEAFAAPDIVGVDAPQVLTLTLVSIGISLKRIADAAEKIAECADGVHPSAFRTVVQS